MLMVLYRAISDVILPALISIGIGRPPPNCYIHKYSPLRIKSCHLPLTGIRLKPVLIYMDIAKSTTSFVTVVRLIIFSVD